MEPHKIEKAFSQVLLLHDELDGAGPPDIESSEWQGFHPKVYTRCNKKDFDKATSDLCRRLQALGDEIGAYSLEMQMWWREHQKADRARIEAEIQAQQDAKARASALEKLTDYERSLLGLDKP